MLKNDSSSSTTSIPTNGVYHAALCGAVSGIVARCFISPLDVLKIRLQLQSHRSKDIASSGLKYTGAWDACKKITLEEGIQGFWKGNWSAIWLYVSYSAVQFASYSYFSNWLRTKHYVSEGKQKFIAGSGAAMVATCVSYPFDLLRTHYSIHPSGPTRPISIVRKIMDTYSTYGFRGYYKGLFPALFQVTPYMGCTFGMYESLSGRFPNHPWVCGAVAGMCAKTLVFPFDTLRRRLQVTVLRSPSLLPLHQDPLLQHSTVRRWVWNMVRSEGLVSLYRGLLPGLLKAAPSSGVTFGVFHGCVSLSESWKSMDSSQP